MNQSGQTLIILLLATLVALTIGLAITQRSLTDVSTSTKIEQSSRAFSAAEAGLGRAIGASGTSFALDNTTLGNQSTADVTSSGLVPKDTDDPTLIGLEYSTLDKTSFAQFWLANPEDTPPSSSYTNKDFRIYFGNVSPNANPAVEVNVITYTDTGNPLTSKYNSYRTYIDSRNQSNGFTRADFCSTTGLSLTIRTYRANSITPTDSTFYCRHLVNIKPGGAALAAGERPILVRVRMLYLGATDLPQKVALLSTSLASKLPPQAVIYLSKGKSGQSLRQIQLFTERNVVPFYFDYAIFSSGNINK